MSGATSALLTLVGGFLQKYVNKQKYVIAIFLIIFFSLDGEYEYHNSVSIDHFLKNCYIWFQQVG